MAVVGSEISAVKMFFSTIFWTLEYSHNNMYKQLLLSAGMRGKPLLHNHCIQYTTRGWLPAVKFWK